VQHDASTQYCNVPTKYCENRLAGSKAETEKEVTRTSTGGMISVFHKSYSTQAGLENRDYGSRGLKRWSRDTPLSAKVGTNFADKRRSLVGKVHSRTKAAELFHSGKQTVLETITKVVFYINTRGTFEASVWVNSCFPFLNYPTDFHGGVAACHHTHMHTQRHGHAHAHTRTRARAHTHTHTHTHTHRMFPKCTPTFILHSYLHMANAVCATEHSREVEN
jgi:hypothetical protein